MCDSKTIAGWPSHSVLLSFTAKPNTWYDDGTTALIICHVHDDFFLMEGIKNGEVDQEICCMDEFDIG